MVYVEVVSNLIGCYQIKKDMADDMEGEYYLRVVSKKITLLKLESKGFEFYLKKAAEKGGKAVVRKEKPGGAMPTGFGRSFIFQWLEWNNEQTKVPVSW